MLSVVELFIAVPVGVYQFKNPHAIHASEFYPRQNIAFRPNVYVILEIRIVTPSHFE